MPFSQNKSYALTALYNRLPASVKGHSVRVAVYMQILMEQVLISAPRLVAENTVPHDGDLLEFIREVGFYHDIGKANVPPEILNKRGPLTRTEHLEMRQHTQYIETLLTPMLDTISPQDVPFLQAVISVGRSHHERWDGTGYPHGLGGHNIPFIARLCSICDTYDAMTTKRPYAAQHASEEASFEILSCAGTQFDPSLVDIFAICKPKFVSINTMHHRS